MTKSSTHSTSSASSSEGGQRAHSGVTTFENRTVKVIRSVVIRRPATELYAFFKDAGNFAKIVPHAASVSSEDPLTSAWNVPLPENQRAQVRLQIINDHPGELLAWSSLEGADLSCAGTLRFEKAMATQGTEVIATLEYDPPTGNLSNIFARISGEDVGQQLTALLNRAKELVESSASSR